MNNPITRAVDSAVGTVKNVTSGVTNKVVGVKDSVVNAADKVIDHAVAVRNLKRNPPTQVTIADLFHKKLYDYADFDFLLNYLRSNGIAECKNIYTIDNLSNEVVPSLTASALRERDVRKINATYAGIMRLCRRRRRGLLAYLSTDGHAQVCLIKSWDRFLQLAGFANTTTADNLTFNTEDVFPKLRINKSIMNKVARYNEQAIEQRREERAKNQNDDTAAVEAPTEEQPLEYKTLDDINDTEIKQVSNNATTSLFNAGQDINFAQMLAMNFAKASAGDINLEWDEEHASDYFMYFLVSKIYPEYTAISSTKEFLQTVTNMFGIVGFTLNAEIIQQLSGNRLRDLKNALALSTVEEKAEVNDMFDKAMKSLAVQTFVFEVNTNATYQEMYVNELTRISNKRQQLATQIRNTTSLIRVPTDAEVAEYIKFEPDFLNVVSARNEEIFKDMWSAAASGNLVDLTNDGFDKIGCLLLFDKFKKISMTLEEYDNALISTINELVPEAHTDWNSLLQTTSGEYFKACHIVRKISTSSSDNNSFAKNLLCQSLSKFYNFRVNADEIWQQIYMGICNAKKSAPRSGLTVSSAAEQLGLVEPEDSTQVDTSNLMTDIDNMEL